MVARIYRPAKTAMQSGKAKTQDWLLEFEPASRRSVEPLMGYTSSSDMLSQVKMRFPTKEDAIAYAERNSIAFRVTEPKEPKRRPMSYSDNFAHDRKIPWTH
ncbi:MAG: ETC complex I subunit [Pseudomonadota bacterium]